MPNWKKVITSGSDAALNSLLVTNSLTASGLIYPSTDGTTGQVVTTDGAGNLSFSNIENTTITIKNVSGVTIQKGTPCYITGSGTSGNLAGVFPADASNPLRMPAGVIAGETLTAGSEGIGLINGFIANVATSAFGAGDTIYVAVGGGYTNVRPTGSSILVQKLGNVEKSHPSNGSGVINGPGYYNDLPNVQSGYTWVGNSNGVAVAIATSSIQNVVSSSYALSASHASSTAAVAGTTNYVSKFTSGTTIGNSQIFDNGTNVGIGTASPSTKLLVNGGFAIQGDSSTPSSGYGLEMWNTSTTSYIGSYNRTTDAYRNSYLYANDTIFENGGLERMRINSSGNVGIGTSNPDAKLRIEGLTYINGEGNGVMVDSGPAADARVGLMKYGGYEGMLIAGNATLLRLGHRTDSVAISGGTPTIREDLVINAAGNVGIGTTSPTQKLSLSVSGASATYIGFKNSSTTDEILVGANAGGDFNLYNPNATPIRFFTSASEHMRITSGGDVGIGTTSPGAKLDVNGDIFLSETGRLQGRAYPYDTTVGSGADASTAIIEAGSTSGYRSRITLAGGNATDPNTIKFLTTSIERMRITSAGDVGIGTTSPDVKFQVQGGAIKATTSNYASPSTGGAISMFQDNNDYGTIWAVKNYNGAWANIAIAPSGGNVGIGTTSPAYKLDVNGNARAAGMTLNAFTTGTSGGNLELGFDGSQGVVQAYNRSSSWIPLYLSGDDIRFNPQGAERMRITDSGNVGIGTTNPGGKLDVQLDTTGDHLVRTWNTNTSGTGKAIIRIANSGNNAQGSQIQFTDNDYYVGTLTADRTNGMSFFVGQQGSPLASERMRIATNGALKFNAYGSGTFTGTATQKLAVDSSGNLIEIPIGAGPVDGSGTANYITKWTDGDTIGNSVMFESGSNIGIGTTSPTFKLSTYISTNSRNGHYIYGDNGGANESIGYRTENANGTGIFFGVNGYNYSSGIGVANESVLYGIGNVALIIGTNSTERMRITPTGNVGIGTTSPSAKLHVAGVDQLLDDGTNGRLTLEINSGQNDIYSTTTAFGAWKDLRYTANDHYFRNGGTEVMRLTGGNVGIGTTNPATLLTISSLAPTFTINRQPTGTQPKISLTDNGSEFSYIQSNAASSIMRYDIGPSTGWGGIHAFYTDTTEKMRITSGGNVGIGTTSPSATLDVRSYALAGATNAPTFRAFGYDTDSYFEVNSNANNSADIKLTRSDSATMFKIDGHSGVTYFAGDVGIGTTSPSQKLDVVGTIKAGIAGNSSANIPALLVASSGTGNEQAAIAIQQATYEGDTIIYADYEPYVEWGISTENNSNLIQFTSGTSTNNLGSKTLYNNAGDARTAYIKFNHNLSTGETLIGGNVGIGTTNPAVRLDYGASVDQAFHLYTSGVDYYGINMTQYDSGPYSTNIFSGDGGQIKFRTSTGTSTQTTRMTITQAGNIGIGTTNPGQKLEVNGRALVDQFQYTKAINYTSGDLDTLTLAGFYDGSGMTNAPNSGWFYVTIEKHSDGTTQWVHQTATSFGSGNTPNEVYTRVRVGSTWGAWKQLGDAASISGNTNYIPKFTSGTAIGNSIIYEDSSKIGIGTTSANAKLHVDAGALGTSANDVLYNSIHSNSNSNGELLEIKSVRTSAGSDWTTAGKRIQMRIDSTYMGYIQFNGTGNQAGISFGTGTTTSGPGNVAERMIIDSSGNVGIGTGPATKLHVNGTVLTTSTLNSAAGSYTIDHPGVNTWKIGITDANTSTLHIGNDTGGSFVNKALNITNGGNVGIGVTSPNGKLQVNGNAYFGTFLNTNIRYSFVSSGALSSYHTYIDNTNSSGGTYGLGVNSNNTSTNGYILGLSSGGTERMIVRNDGYVGIGTSSPGYKLDVNGDTNITGTLTATVKSFIIDHPTKENKKLQYGVLEGPEHSVYVRGKLTNTNVIQLPDYWHALVHEDSITVNLTAIGKPQEIWVEEITDTYITVGSLAENINCFYAVFAERKDIDKLVTEFDKE